MRIVLLILCAALASCTTIDHSRRVEDWPMLAVDLRVVSSREMRDACSQYSSWYETPLACAQLYFDERVCRVWVTEGDQHALQHELLHCVGYEHPGSDYLQRALDRSRSAHGA